MSLGDGEDHPIGNTGLYWNLYTAPAWLAVFLCLLNIVVLLPFIVKEFHIAKEEGELLAARGLKKMDENLEEKRTKIKPDKLALVTCIFFSAAIMFHFNLIERYERNLIYLELINIFINEKKTVWLLYW